MPRRLISATAGCAVIASSLVWAVAPASAAISGASITPSVWNASQQAQAVVSWSESTSTNNNNAFNDTTPSAGGNFISIEVGWGWSFAHANPTATAVTYAATWDATAKSFTCATIGVTFQSAGFSSTGTGPECLVRRSSAGSDNPGQQVVLGNQDTSNHFSFAGTESISVTFAAGTVTAPSSGPASDTWRIISVTGANTTTVSTSVPAVDSAGNVIPLITIDIDSNEGTCTVDKVTGIQGTWTIAPNGAASGSPGAGTCSKPGASWTGFNTSPDGSGTAIAIGGNLHLTGANRIYAQYETQRVSGAPTDVVATGGLKSVKVSWAAPSDTGSSPIAAYLVQATPGGSTCVTNPASANMLDCTYTNLVPGTQYSFKVQALNRAGWGEFSAESNVASPYDVLLDSISRPEVKFLIFARGSRLEAQGRAPGLGAGTVLTPVMQLGSDGAFVPLARDTTRVKRDGTFSWSRKVDKRDNRKPVSLYFTYGDAKTTTLTAKLGATIGLPSKPRNLKVTSNTNGITVSWNPPARDGGSPIATYEMTSDLRAPGGARSRFISCKVTAPTTTCTMRAGVAFDPNKTYTFSVVAKTERGTSPQATEKWKGEDYRLNIYRKVRTDSDVQLSFTASGWSNPSQAFEVQAKVGANGAWKKQGTARLNPDYVQSAGDWEGKLPKSATAGSDVFFRLKSNKGFSNEVSFRLSSSYEYSAD